MTEISSVIHNVPVYTRKGTFVGQVENAILDLGSRTVEALLLTDTNTEVVDQGADVAVPYRWVSDFDDIMVLRYFPDEVSEEEITAAGPNSEGEDFIEITA